MLHRGRRKEHRPPPGAPPGSLSPTPHAYPTHLHLIAYQGDQLIEHGTEDLAEIEARARGMANVWIDVAGLRNIDVIRELGERYGLHPLTLEDIVQVVQRPKVDVYEGYVFVVLRLPRLEDELSTEQLAIVLGPDFLLTFCERPGEGLAAVRRRLTHVHSRMRSHGVDYLAYAVVDALIDAYFPILEHFGEMLDRLELEVVEHTADGMVSRIHATRRTVMELRRAIWPLREMLNTLMRESTPYIQPETRVFLRDCGDHVAQLLDMIEIDREVTATLLDLHLSSLSARMNEIMKVLTIIATIFIPLGFFVGLYGMNFDTKVSPWNMPELGWRYGYPYALAVMALGAFGMLGYFWAKGWIGQSWRRRGRGAKRDQADAARRGP